MAASEYSRPEVPYSGYSDLYFATERDVQSLVAFGSRDRGELVASPGRVEFRGMQILVDCRGVTAIRLVRKTFPWISMLALSAVASVLTYFNTPAPLTWRQPFPYVILVILLVVCARYLSERWVEVVYFEGATERRAYFRRSPLWWGSGRARTRRLYEELKQSVLATGESSPDRRDA